MKLEEVVTLDFEIVVVDGLRVGGGGGEMEIGGTVDANLSALRDVISGEPYIPGSSMKGKLRSLTESVNGASDKSGRPTQDAPCGCGQITCAVCTIFGAHMHIGAPSSPTRIRVRDAHFSPAYKKEYDRLMEDSGRFFENKTENIVGRRTGAATHPRTGERIPPGARFQAQIVLRIYDNDQGRKTEYVQTLERALGLLAQADSLGASGSRGYGAIRIETACITSKAVSGIAVVFQECADKGPSAER